MREIKFRTWDTEKQEFSEWTNRDPFFSTSHGQIFFWERTRKEDGSYGGDIILQDLSDRFILQQYTGLKDKNGKEIYEGDILTYADNTTPEQIFEVKFLDERGTFVFRELYNPTFEGSDLPGWDDVILGQNAWDGWEIADAAKVIGNIFEGVDK